MARRGSSDLMSEITRGAHLKAVEGGCSPGGTPSLIKSKRGKREFTLGGVAGALSQALDAKFKHKRLHVSDSEDDSSSSGYSSSDDDGDDEPRQVRIVRVAARRNTPSHLHTAVGPVDVINTIISPIGSANQLNKSRGERKRKSQEKKKQQQQQQQKQHPPSQWGMGQHASVARGNDISIESTKAKRKLSMGNVLGSIKSFDKSKMTNSTADSAETGERSEDNKCGGGGAGGGGGARRGDFLGGIASFDKSTMKSPAPKSMTNNNRQGGGGGLLGAISSFKAGSLKKVQSKSKHCQETTVEKPQSVLQQAIANRRLRKVPTNKTKGGRAKQVQGESGDAENSPSFFRVRNALRKTGMSRR